MERNDVKMNEYKIYPKQFLSVNMMVEKNRCFVIMPFDEKLNYVYGIIKKQLSSKGFICNRVDEIGGATPIINKILTEMLRSRYIIADLTDCNPNVFYELGIAHSFKDAQNIIILKQKGSKVPFDITHLTYIEYEPDNPFLLTSSIVNCINQTKHIVDLEEALKLRGILSPTQNTEPNIVDFFQGQLADNVPMLTCILLNEHIHSNCSEKDIELFLTRYQNTLQAAVNHSNIQMLNDWLKCYCTILISCDSVSITEQFIEVFLNSDFLLNISRNKASILEWQTEFAISIAKAKKYLSIAMPWIIRYLAHSQTASIDLNRYKVEAFLMTNQHEEINQIIVNAVFDKNCYLREHISDIIGEKRLYTAADNLCAQLKCEENYYVSVSIMEALGKLDCKNAITVIETWIEAHKENIINEKQFFVLKHARIVLSKLTKETNSTSLDDFDKQFKSYLIDYFIL